MNAKVYILGNKYDIPALRDVAVRKYEEVVKEWWNSQSPTIAGSAQFVDENIPSKKDRLRDIVVEAAREYLARVMEIWDIVDLLPQNAEPTWDLFVAVSSISSERRNGDGLCRCSFCGSSTVDMSLFPTFLASIPSFQHYMDYPA